MTKTVKALCIVVGLFCVLWGLAPKGTSKIAMAETDQIKGVWAATLYSMDYPSKPTTDADTLRRDADRLISAVSEHGFNALFIQVRPSGDAFYKSEIYPISRYLTGTEGTAPTDGFDPLDYIVEKAHKSGIAVHAWINPYRITASEKDNENLSEGSIAKKYPHLIVKHTDGKLYLNPGEPEAMDLVVGGAEEIAKNYKVDGIHIDDYFYPSSAFPDGETFTKYGGGFLNIGDWRRDNTAKLVEKMKTAIKRINPNIIFSASPCGIWANKSSNAEGSHTSGKQAYFDYFADTRLWAREGLVDMIIPQVYWETGNSLADFQTVAKWWNDQLQDTNTILCIGQGVYKTAEATDTASPWYGEKGRAEIENQLRYIKGLENVRGYVQYRIGSITSNPELSRHIKTINTSTLRIFSDTKDYPWAEDSIERLYKSGIVKGMGDGSFGCKRWVSRADFMVMLVRLTGQNVAFNENFADVTKDKYYYNEIGTAKALGFAAGRENNIFDPQGNITREDMATLVWRVMTKMGKLPESADISLEEKFSDANEISEYAKNAVSILVKEKLLSGYETGEFKPKGYATRAECAVVLDRLN